MKKKEHEVWTAVQEMNRSWTCGQHEELEKLTDFFHETMVAITPVDRLRVEGKMACIAGWSGFARAATIHHWLEKEAKVQLYGETAVVTYYFDMVYELGGRRIHMGGRDMLTLIKEDGRWQVVADQFSPYPLAGEEVVG